MFKPATAVALGLLAFAGALGAQAPTISVGNLACLPIDGNAPLTAQLSPDTAGASLRLYFRRMSLEVEDFYYVEMRPAGDGGYWGVFPDPEDQPAVKKALKGESEQVWAKWWRAKEASENRDPNPDLDKDVIEERAALGKLERRTWMTARDDKALQEWLDKLQNEPADYYVAAYDARGRLLAKSDQRVVEVKKKDCDVKLTPQQEGFADNLTVGETRDWQKGKAPFHWECDGLVTRIDTQGILRADDSCRACVIAWWMDPLVAVVPAAIGLISISDDDPDEISPSRP